MGILDLETENEVLRARVAELETWVKSAPMGPKPKAESKPQRPKPLGPDRPPSGYVALYSSIHSTVLHFVEERWITGDFDSWYGVPPLCGNSRPNRHTWTPYALNGQRRMCGGCYSTGLFIDDLDALVTMQEEMKTKSAV